MCLKQTSSLAKIILYVIQNGNKLCSTSLSVRNSPKCRQNQQKSHKALGVHCASAYENTLQPELYIQNVKIMASYWKMHKWSFYLWNMIKVKRSTFPCSNFVQTETDNNNKKWYVAKPMPYMPPITWQML